MMHALLVPFLAGLLAGVNPYNAHLLRARLQERTARNTLPEVALLTLIAFILVAGISWRFSIFISGRLTNGLLFLGLFALAAAFYSLRPLRRRGEPDPVPTGWRWTSSYLGDVLYTAGPAWLVGAALAMKQLRFTDFLASYAAAALGILVATLLWTLGRRHLPMEGPRVDRPRTRVTLLLALSYAFASLLMLAGNLKLV